MNFFGGPYRQIALSLMFISEAVVCHWQICSQVNFKSENFENNKIRLFLVHV